MVKPHMERGRAGGPSGLGREARRRAPAPQAAAAGMEKSGRRPS